MKLLTEFKPKNEENIKKFEEIITKIPKIENNLIAIFIKKNFFYISFIYLTRFTTGSKAY